MPLWVTNGWMLFRKLFQFCFVSISPMENKTNIRQLGFCSSQCKSDSSHWSQSIPEAAIDFSLRAAEFPYSSSISDFFVLIVSSPPSSYSLQKERDRDGKCSWLWDLTLARDVGVFNSLMLKGASRSNFLQMRDLVCEVLSGQDHIHEDNSNTTLADTLYMSVSLDFSVGHSQFFSA